MTSREAASDNDDLIDLERYVILLRDRWYVPVLGGVLLAIVAFLTSQIMTPTYEADVLVMIGRGSEATVASTSALYTSEELAKTYAHLAQIAPILDATASALGLTQRPDPDVTIITGTQLLRITVQDAYAERAAAIANELAHQLIVYTSGDADSQSDQVWQAMSEHLRSLEYDIAEETAALVAAQARGDTQRVRELGQNLSDLETAYTALAKHLESTSVSDVRVVQPAEVPTAPSKPRPLMNAVLGGVVGASAGVFLVILVNYLDKSIKDREDVQDSLDLALLASVPDVPDTIGSCADFWHDDSLHLLWVESYRVLCTNVRYSLPAELRGNALLITSVVPGEGKSTVCANLAFAEAERGNRVSLVDADMRRPRLASLLECKSDVGLSSFLVGEVDDVDAVLQNTSHPRVRCVASGPLPPNPVRLLSGARMQNLLTSLQQRCDTVIVDSPPILVATDARVLAGMNLPTIVVIQAKATSVDEALEAIGELERSKSQILGAVLNRAWKVSSRRDGHYHYRYDYHTGT